MLQREERHASTEFVAFMHLYSKTKDCIASCPPGEDNRNPTARGACSQCKAHAAAAVCGCLRTGFRLGGAPRIDDQLQRFQILKTVDLGTIGHADPMRNGSRVVEHHRLETPDVRGGDGKSQVLAGEDTLLQNAEFAFE